MCRTLFCFVMWGNMLATHESQSLSRKDSIPALLCHALFCTATSLPHSLHLGLFCEIVLSSTPLPSHPLTSSSEHAMNPQQEIHWKAPAELLLKERTDTAIKNPSAELWCNGIICGFYWVLKLIWVMQVLIQMCPNFEKVLNTLNFS